MVHSPVLHDNTIEIYQLHIWIKGISPMIWRRLLVKSNSTIADLHYIIQIAMGWKDEHLHQFIIRGKSYGIPYIGGVDFNDDAKRVYLSDFKFCLKEKFTYEYDFSDYWEHEIHFEKKLPIDVRKTYPLCIGGGHCAPPEDCGGPWAFMELRDQYSLWNIQDKIVDLLRNNEDDNEDEDEDEDSINDTLQTLGYWYNKQHMFKLNRWEINNQLQLHFQKKKEKKTERTKGG